MRIWLMRDHTLGKAGTVVENVDPQLGGRLLACGIARGIKAGAPTVVVRTAESSVEVLGKPPATVVASRKRR